MPVFNVTLGNYGFATV